MGDAKGVPQMPPNANVNVENGNTKVLVGGLHWWTRDSEIESVVIQYGRVKEIRFFGEGVNGKSKGYCQVEFYDSAAASACKDGMNGHVFNGRACVVEFVTPQTIRQMEDSYMNRTYGQAQLQPQPQPQLQGRNLVIEANLFKWRRHRELFWRITSTKQGSRRDYWPSFQYDASSGHDGPWNWLPRLLRSWWFPRDASWSGQPSFFWSRNESQWNEHEHENGYWSSFRNVE